MSNLTTPRPVPVRTRSVSPRPTYTRKSYTPSPKPTPKLSGSFEARRPKSAIGVPSEFSRKPLTPTPVKGSTSLRPAKKHTGSDKPAPIKPKAGSDKPVAIRGRPRNAERPPMPFQRNLSPESSDSEDDTGRNGYYIYIYNEKMNKSQGHNEGKPTASVRPMKFSREEKDADEIEPKDPSVKLDLKPMMLNISPADSLESVLA